MKKAMNCLLGAASGAAYAALTVFLSRILIRNLHLLFQWIGSLAALEEDTLSYGVQILIQLKDAAIASPWLYALPAGVALGALIAWPKAKKPVRKIILCLVAGLILILPLALIVLWFSEVNAVGVSSLLNTLLPIVPHLL